MGVRPPPLVQRWRLWHAVQRHFTERNLQSLYPLAAVPEALLQFTNMIVPLQ